MKTKKLKKKIKKYRIYGKVVGGKYIGEVEAYSEKEALVLAEKLPEMYVSFCHQCSRHCEDAELEDIFISEIG